MAATLYEQFLAVGSVKSLLTGKEISAPQSFEKKAPAIDKTSDTTRLKDTSENQR
ncbi:MAG: hypothetical protein J5787_08220 [Alphaproteobacteria bacterium]|nr:hypothetical protein [Alphaproteobacteria bacterium]MBO4644833.1 hypothetical protein [Alphaproteobacteria bacterium]